MQVVGLGSCWVAVGSNRVRVGFELGYGGFGLGSDFGDRVCFQLVVGFVPGKSVFRQEGGAAELAERRVG